ncbi:MAG: hypothetical protein DIU60_019965, partial [Actinomycetes bacterium]|jgi:hypothetical protein
VVGVPPDAAQLQADRIYLGWQYVLLHPDPGPPPKRPSREETAPPIPEEDPEWLRRERLQEDLLNRPLRVFNAFMWGATALIVVAGLGGWLDWRFALAGALATGGIATVASVNLHRGGRAARARAAARAERLERLRRERDKAIVRAQEEHAERYREWAERKANYDNQMTWYAVAVPDEVDRIDVAGGTMPGWSALVTLIGATRLYSGGHLTVLDLSEGAIAKDLIELARRGGDNPLVWVLPGDLPRLDLGVTLGPEAFADVLAHVVSVSEDQHATRDLSFDNAILERVLEVLGEKASIRQVTAALRALAQVGDPREDLREGLLTAHQLERIGTMFGRGVSDRVVIERAWAIESQLRKLEPLGTAAVRLPPARLRVVSMDRQSGVFGNRVLGTYVAAALTHILRQSPPSERPWYHTIIVAGAEKLRGDVLDRLMDACETARAGLVLTYRSLTPAVRERLGRGNAAVAFMRLGNAEDARVAAEHIGTQHRLEIAHFTESTGAAVEGMGATYTSTVSGGATHEAVRTGGGDLAEDITRSTEWGRRASTALAAGGAAGSAGPGGGAPEGTAAGNGRVVLQRSREFLVEPQQLQQLPTTSVIVTHTTAEGRKVRLADANPAILTFPKTTLGEFEEVQKAMAAAERERKAPPADRPPPNLGPPPPRLDWRKPHR